jgi:hypothetical protein
LVYGNEPGMSTRYASICMIASAPGHDVKGKWPKGKKFDNVYDDYDDDYVD